MASKNPKISFKKIEQSTDYTCGLASLAISFSAFGQDYTEEDLLKLTKVSKETGTDEKDMIDTAKKLGFKVKTKVNANISDIEKAIDEGHPVVVLYHAWKEGHYSVIVGHNSTHFMLADPYKKGCVRTMRKDLFNKRWAPKYQPHLVRWMMVISK